MTDRKPVSRVTACMHGLGRTAGLLAALALPACGGKDKKDATTPASTIPGWGTDGTRPEDMDPNVSGDVPTTTFGQNGQGGRPGAGGGGAAGGGGPAAGAGSEGAGGGASDGGGAPTEAAPPIKPPGLDLTPAEKAARVRPLLQNAQAALSKSPPDAETALAEAQNALAVDEQNLEAMLYLADANVVKGYYDKAEYTLVQAEKTTNGPGSSKLFFLRGLVYEMTDREDDAEKAYKKSVSLDANNRSALLNLGVYHIKNKRYREAAELYERLTGPLGSRSPAAWTNLGSAYRGQTANAGLDAETRRGLLLKAESAFKKALSFDAKYANAHYNLGVLYLDADPYPSASGDMDTLARLQQARTHFDEYSRMPAADTKLAKEQMAVAQKLYDREKRIRDKKREREERQKKANQG